jgi:peptidoglycan LD-endopeptidase LytH
MTPRRITILVGLCFSLGALTDAILTWRLHEFDPASTLHGTSNSDGATSQKKDPEAVGTVGSVNVENAIRQLRGRRLELPVYGIKGKDIRDTYFDKRGTRAHEALDIMAPRGTPVLAAEAGRIEKLFTSKAGGLTIYQFDPSELYCYYYAHLDSYARSLHEGDSVQRGDVIGYVGSTGNAAEDAPHLHFAIFRLTPARQWWNGEPINPYQVFANR